MKPSKNKSTARRSASKPRSAFAILATRAMIKAQKVAAEENARFGLPLIVEKTR
jgi:hypothetical protein